jgi:tetratricopeptide (TPR) repeat protein
MIVLSCRASLRMTRTLSRLVTIIAVLTTFSSLTGFASTGRLGQADFANSCNSAVQASFEEAILLLHSFEFQQAENNFRQVESADPHCAIAAWGLALAETERAGANAPEKVLEKGWKELRPWLSRPAGSERERFYIDAVRAMYEGYWGTSGTVRWSRYLPAMDSIRKKYPNDLNADLFYSLGLVWTAGSGQEGLNQRQKALDILMPIFKKYPDNPGAAHYIIHAADTPELARIALPAARKYAAIAPDSPHALHMPSHIFNRLGDWRDSIHTNLASAHVAAEWIKDGRGGLFDEQHALNNLEYAYLQMGKLEEARSIIGEIDQLARVPGGDPWGPIDARIYFDIETHDWSEALALEPPSKAHFEENFDVYWIHTIANARLGKPLAARAALEQFRESSKEWTSGHGWGDVLHLALAEAEAWTIYAEGKREDAVRELSDAVDFEKRHPVYYADVLPRPSSEVLGDMLLQMGKEKDACSAFQASLLVTPNTFNALHGQRRCADRSSAQ